LGSTQKRKTEKIKIEEFVAMGELIRIITFYHLARVSLSASLPFHSQN
jgi:hypothetical protein